MSWIAPLASIPEKQERFHPNGMPDTSREVVIDGVRYASITEARRKLGWSYSKIYRVLGGPHKTARPVEINGVRYPTMGAAAKALGCSYSKIYYLIGERWRVKEKR